jgi:hypothetical protein
MRSSHRAAASALDDRALAAAVRATGDDEPSRLDLANDIVQRIGGGAGVGERDVSGMG